MRFHELVVDNPGSVKQRIARDGLILRVLAGSGVHGIAIEGTDDVDEMGICLEPPETVVGLKRFDHYIYRTQPEGARSGPGDLDFVVYSARKYLSLAMSGNPTVLLPLFVPDEHVRFISWAGRDLRENADRIVSKLAAARFLGYLDSQRRGLRGERAGGNGAGRQDIIEQFGFDVKFAAHMVRLGMQGEELLRTGRITLPVCEEQRTVLRGIREGQYTMQDTLDMADEWEEKINLAVETSDLPSQPDYDWADQWLYETHEFYWRGL